MVFAAGHAIEMRKVWTEDCQLPGVVYDHALGHMPEPMESKWQAAHHA